MPIETNIHTDALCFMVKTRARHKTTETVLHNGWRLVAVGGWGLVVGGGWRLAVGGGWWLAVGGWWRLVVGGWWRLAVGGRWRLGISGWWRLAGSVAVGGPWWSSLRAVLNKKFGSLRTALISVIRCVTADLSDRQLRGAKIARTNPKKDFHVRLAQGPPFLNAPPM